MKKLFLSLFVAGSLTFGLQSCGEDEADPCDGVTCPAGEVCDDGDCVTDPNAETCDECGVYDTEADGYILIPAVDIDTTWSRPDSTINIPAEFIKSGSDYSLSVDLTSVTSLLSDPIEVEGSYNTTTKLFTVTDFSYLVLNAVEVLINGTADFSTTDEATGTLTIVAPAGSSLVVDGELNFEGVKQ